MATPRPRNRLRTPNNVVVRTNSATEVLPAALPDGKGGLFKVEPWGPNNLLPQEMLRVLYDSGTASTCVERLGQFIGGRGFANKATATAMANPLQTFNQLLAEAAEYAAVGLGVAYILRYSYGGELAETYVAPADCLRREKLTEGERYVVNYKLALGKMPATENQVYLPYNPLATQEELSEQVIAAVGSEAGYWGHVLFSFGKKVGRGTYPAPTWWAAKEALEADAEVPRYDLKQFRNGFYPDTVMTVVGKKFDDVDDDRWEPDAAKGETEADRPGIKSPDRVALEASLKDMKGSRSESSVLLLTVETEQEKPQLDFIDKGPNSKGLTDATSRIEGRVYRRMGVPPVLCGVAEPGMLGSNQQIVNSIQLFGLVVGPRRAQCTEPLQPLYPHLDFSVTPLDPVDYIDPAVAEQMTADELRALRSLPPVEKPKDSKAQKTLRALNSMSPPVATKVMNELTSAEIRALAELDPLEVQTPRPRTKAPAAQ